MVTPSSRLLSLLTNSTSLLLLRRRPFSLLRLAPLTTAVAAAAGDHRRVHLCRYNSLIPIKIGRNFYYSKANYNNDESNRFPANDYLPSHPWMEWSRLVESISVAGYFNGGRNIEDEFVANENLSMEFVNAASSCLAFARDRPDILGLLPRKDIEVLIDDGYPFLFKNAHETERRMRSFLQVDGSNEASSVDLMKYILSYASNPIIYPERNIKEAIESSVRSLLQEMANLSYTGQYSNQFQAVGRDEEMPGNLGPNITMKRGDWICPKCSFMNFARNTKCLECEELRPQRQLTDGEWDCPQCNFFNYRRNTVCLKCECRRPGEVPSSGSPRQQMGSHYDDNGGSNFRVRNKNLEHSVERNPNQFLGNTPSDLGTYNSNFNGGHNVRKDGYVPFVPLPADMFAKKPEKITNDNEHSEEQCSEKSTTYVQSRYISDIDKEEKSERWFKKAKELHGVTGPISDFPQIMPTRNVENRFVDSKKKDRPFSPYEKQRAMEQGNNTSSFVPFPPDYFAKKDNQPQPESPLSTMKPADHISSGNSQVNSDISYGHSQVNPNISYGHSQVNPGTSLGHSHWTTSTPSSHSHVNSGISYGHSHVNPNISYGHSQVNPGTSSGHSHWNTGTPSGHSHVNPGISYGHSQVNPNIPSGHSHMNPGISYDHSHVNPGIPSGNSHGNPYTPSGYSHVNQDQDISSGYSQQNQHMTRTNKADSDTHSSNNHFTRNETTNISQKPPENRSGWTGKSLEGSAVTEPDPLDMSEEAKAERWFRRVAQIKDISELSQIPDEDFPSIMPMRKGVNRFVVSKRKTPLERRLTSPQYRKNLRIMSSDPPMKREGDDDN